MSRIKPACLSCLFIAFLWSVFLAISKIVFSSKLVSATGVNLAQRLITSCILLIPFLMAPRQERRLMPKHWAPMLFVAFFLTGLMYCSSWAFQLYGQGVANAAILGRIDSLFAIVIGWVVFRMRVRATELLALAGMILGTTLITVKAGQAYRFDQWAGDGLIIVATLMTSVNAYVIRFALAELHNSAIAFFNNVFSCGMMAVIYLGLEMRSGVIRADAANLMSHPALIACCMAMGAIAAVFFLFYYYALYQIPVWQVRAFMLFMPFFAVPIAMLTPSLHETITFREIAGMIIVTVFAYWLMWLSRFEVSSSVSSEARPETTQQTKESPETA